MSIQQQTPAKVKCKVNMAATKIHGPNSPDVLAGRVPLGHCEDVPFDEPEQYIEVSYAEAVEAFGVEAADKLFGKENPGGDS